MEKTKKIKLFIGLSYLVLIIIFLSLFFSKFSLQEITSYEFIKENRSLDKDAENKFTALYGYWGGGINITDGKYSYFHYPENFSQQNPERYQYTLMPTHMRQFFSNEELQTATLHKPFDFTKDIPLLKINRIERKTDGGYKGFEDTKSALYNLQNDPGQLTPLADVPNNKSPEAMVMSVLDSVSPSAPLVLILLRVILYPPLVFLLLVGHLLLVQQ